MDTPASIQAISGDALQSAGVSGIMDIAGEIPGLSIQDLGPGDKKYVIRGINSTGYATTGVYYGEAVISGSNGDDGGGFESDSSQDPDALLTVQPRTLGLSVTRKF